MVSVQHQLAPVAVLNSIYAYCLANECRLAGRLSIVLQVDQRIVHVEVVLLAVRLALFAGLEHQLLAWSACRGLLLLASGQLSQYIESAEIESAGYSNGASRSASGFGWVSPAKLLFGGLLLLGPIE